MHKLKWVEAIYELFMADCIIILKMVETQNPNLVELPAAVKPRTKMKSE